MRVDEFGDDGEAESDAVFLRGVERVEDLLAQFGRNAGARVFDGYLDARRFRSDAQVQDGLAVPSADSMA